MEKNTIKILNQLKEKEDAVILAHYYVDSEIQEIADYMHISINNVKFHLSNIYQKVQVSNRKELEKYLNR